MAAPSPTPSPETPGAIRWTGLLLVVATVLAYANTLGGPLIFDDKPAILDNPTIRHLWPLSTVLSPPAIGSGVTGRPMVNLTRCSGSCGGRSANPSSPSACAPRHCRWPA